MYQFDVTKDIIPMKEFKTNPSKWFRNVKETGHPIIITQYGKAAGVLLSPEEYELLVKSVKKQLYADIQEGIEDIKAGRFYTTEELKSKLDKELDAENNE